jgi:HEAT repeat protein
MKKFTIILILTFVTAALGFSSSEEVQVYDYLYNTAPNHQGQLDILQNMAQARLTGAGEFYAKALRKLLADYKNIKDNTERSAAEDQAMILSAMLGAEKYTQAASDLWLVVDAFPNAPLVRAEALMALGKVRANNYLPQVIRVLESLNASPTSDRLYGERVAFGAIISLEKFQDPSGYLPVFFASTGWYSDRIKSQATKSLPFIAQDPTPYMVQVVKGAGYDFPTKYLALRTIEAAKIDSKNKAEVAVVALSEGWRSNTNDVNLRTTLAEMRKMAIGMINRYKTEDQTVYPLLERSYSQGYDTQEKLNAIATLASLGSDESARRLAKFLADLNTKRRDGNITREDGQMVRAIIPALGQTGRTNVMEGRAALISVGASNWTPAVKALADTELKKYR